MLIGVRVGEAARRASLIALLSLATTAGVRAEAPAITTPQSGVAAMLDRYENDPGGAIAALEALRADPANADHHAAGPPLLNLYIKQRQLEQAKALVDVLLAEQTDNPSRDARVLGLALQRMHVANDWSGLDAIEPRVRTVAANDSIPVAERAFMLHHLMVVYSRIPRFDDAITTLDETVTMLGAAPSVELLDALRAKGAIHALQGRFPEAIEALRHAERVVSDLGRPVDTGILRNLAGIFINLGEFDRAIEYADRAEQALHTMSPPASPGERMGVVSVLATAHIGARHFEPAQRWLLEALEIGRRHNLPTNGVLNNYATLLRDEGRDAEALKIFRELSTQISPGDRPEVRGVVEKNIGQTLVKLNRRAEAAGYLQRAREIYETADIRPKRLELYPVLIDNLEALGRTAEALVAMREFKRLSDETIDTESRTRIGELENAIDLERKNKALADAEAANGLQRAENDMLQARQSRANAISLALAASLVAAIAVLALLWRTYRSRNRSHRELTARNAEVELQRSELEALNASIHRQSREDALTGLGNRRRLLEAMAGPAATNANGSLLVMADLDRFKQINDQHGHDIGDRALRLFADSLRATARNDDLLVRWGGEEFVWVCRGASVDQGPALCERLLRQLRETPLDVDGEALLVTASLGFVPLPVWSKGDPGWETALRIADYAVYRSKARGRASWTGFIGVGTGEDGATTPPATLETRGALRRV